MKVKWSSIIIPVLLIATLYLVLIFGDSENNIDAFIADILGGSPKAILGLVTLISMGVSIVLGIVFLISAIRRNKRIKRAQAKLRREERRIHEKRRRFEQQYEDINKQLTERETISNSLIVIDLPNALKNIFIESLRAFEDYAELRGYEVRFSFDNSIKDKLGFKFTITGNPNNISEDEVRADIKDFMDKVSKGESFNDMPIIINKIEHQFVLTTLKNRINFIEHSYNLEKNARQLYEKVVNEMLTSKNIFSPQISTYIQTGGEKNITKGTNINFGEGNYLKIDKSFNNDQKSIVEKIEYSIQQIDNEEKLSAQDKQDLKRHLENIKEEITDEAQPDASKLKKSWEKIKKIAEGAVFSYDLTLALQWISNIFNF